MAANPSSPLPAGVARTSSAPLAHDRGFFGHPRGLRTLFFTEMWERFSYYGMRAILQLFMLAPIAAGGLGLPKSESGPIYAMYTSLVYLMCIPGGWLADNILGQRRSVFLGGLVIMTGHILLAMHGMTTFYAGLGCVILGTGLLKPNISAIVGQLYEEKDSRREAGFSFLHGNGYWRVHSAIRLGISSRRNRGMSSTGIQGLILAILALGFWRSGNRNAFWPASARSDWETLRRGWKPSST
jgi:POT family proton-dependent oligopeptide transporter